MSPGAKTAAVASLVAEGCGGSADPTTIEIIRQSLNSAANQMKRALVRTAFSPTIYESLDFAVALYDRRVRLLAQAPTIPAFLGTLNFCVKAAVAGIGGEECLQPGDLLLYNVPYGSGSHAQDFALIAPVFHQSAGLVGYAVNKAHHVDVGAKNPYCTDTTDVFQEGVIFPGVKLHSAGTKVVDIYRLALSNSRAPEAMKGDLHAQESCARVGTEALLKIVDRFGFETFCTGVERMFEQSEREMRAFIGRIPAGSYVGRGHFDDDGVSPEPIQIEVTVSVNRSEVDIDYSRVPDARSGPINCPLPSTVSASRVAVLMVASSSTEPNEGHFRPIRVRTREGSMYHPLSPAPCFLNGWAVDQAIEAILLAFAQALPRGTCAGSAADIASVGVWMRHKETKELIDFGPALPVGHGGRPDGDGHVLFVPALSSTRAPSVELVEAKLPVRYHKWELVTDSFGIGRFLGAPAWDHDWEILQDGALISTIDRTIVPSVGVLGGGSGAPNRFFLVLPDGTEKAYGRVTDAQIPRHSILRVRCGGGGGYGPPDERPLALIEADLLDGLMSDAFARRHFPQSHQRVPADGV